MVSRDSLLLPFLALREGMLGKVELVGLVLLDEELELDEELVDELLELLWLSG